MKRKIFLLLVLSIALLSMQSLSITSAASDGDLTVSSSDTIVNDYAYLTFDEAAGDNVLAVNDATPFSVGDEILIIQMQTEAGGVVGEHEFATITSITGNELTLSSDIQHSYYSGSFDSEDATVAQVVRVPQYTTVTIDSGASMTAKAWDGYSGGIIAFKAQTTLTNNGSIDANAKGYRGGNYQGDYGPTTPGESYTGIFNSASMSANDGGGGYGSQTSYAGGGNGAHGGGGGGHQTIGQDGELSAGTPTTAPEGGLSYSDSSGEMLTFGSGGGAGGDDSYQQVDASGGHGGGIVYILSPTIVNNGTITTNGADGETPSGGLRGGAGGGAGGYVYLVTNSSELGTVEVNGGSGGQSSIPSRGVGGAGGTGYYSITQNSEGDSILIASAPDTAIYPGDTFSVALNIQGANDLYGAQATCIVDRAILEAQSGMFGDFFDSTLRLVAANQVEASAGSWFGAISQQNPAEPLDGDGLLATLTYSALTPGTTAISCEQPAPLLSDRNGFSLPSATISDSITVRAFATISGTATYQGRLDHSNIDVKATGPISNSNSTESSGLFEIAELRAGDYQVKADAPSYLPACTTSDVALSSGQLATLPLTILLGGDVNDDIESDTIINIGDFTRLTTSFNQPASADAQADINADGTINIQDLTILGGNYDVSGCQDW